MCTLNWIHYEPIWKRRRFCPNINEPLWVLVLQSVNSEYLFHHCKTPVMKSFQLCRTLDGRYICPKCPNTYSSRNAVKLHMWNHNGVKPYTCNVCDKSFGRVDYLRRHKQDVHRNKPPGERSTFWCNHTGCVRYWDMDQDQNQNNGEQ